MNWWPLGKTGGDIGKLVGPNLCEQRRRISGAERGCNTITLCDCVKIFEVLLDCLAIEMPDTGFAPSLIIMFWYFCFV